MSKCGSLIIIAHRIARCGLYWLFGVFNHSSLIAATPLPHAFGLLCKIFRLSILGSRSCGMSEDVVRAIQSAKYNESVQITVTDDAGNARVISLVACLDKDNGGVQWNDADDHGSSSGQSAVLRRHLNHGQSSGQSAVLRRHLRTKRWIFPMLNDQRRNELYEEAIERASEEVGRRRRLNADDGEPSDDNTVQCLDIGSGSGLLAMMAATSLKKRLNNDPIQVTSIEMSGAMAEIARATVVSNELGAYVNVVEGHSCEIPPLIPKALLCTSELLESGLLGEGWIPAIRDAWERHLDPDAVVVPRAAKVYAQIVEGSGVSNFWGPHQKLDGFPSGKSLSLSLDSEGTNVLLGGGLDAHPGVQVPLHIDKLLQDVNHPIRTLSNPLEVLEIRLDSRAGTPTSPQTRSTTFIPSVSGIAYGVLFWWQLDLFGDDLSYNTGPKMGPWQDHWQQCLYAFDRPSEELLRVKKGQPTTIQTSHDDTSISFSVIQGEIESSRNQTKRPRTASAGAKLISPQRAWQLNDLERSTTIRDGVKILLDQRGLDAVVLDLSDFSLCAIMAALLGASNVTSLEASSSNLPESTARIAQLSNRLPLPRRKGSIIDNVFQLLRCHPEELTIDILGGSAADIVVAEPYYEILEGWVLQEALNFLYIIRGLKRRHVIRSDAVTMPSYAKIMGCAFESSDIGEAYRTCDTRIRGFSHDFINDHHTLSEHGTSIPSWQYDITQLSEAFEIGTLDYMACTIDQSNSQQSVPFTRTGKCHGMLVWIEYGVPASLDGTSMSILSTRGRSYHQIIQLLDESSMQNVNLSDLFSCHATIGKGVDHHFELSIQRASS